MARRPDQIKFCNNCGKQLIRKRFNGRLEDYGVFLRRKACSQSCANARQTVTKDAQHWRARKHRAEKCQECGSTNRLHVHHLDRNVENNDSANLRTLCASCHLKLHWREDGPTRARKKSAGGSTN